MDYNEPQVVAEQPVIEFLDFDVKEEFGTSENKEQVCFTDLCLFYNFLLFFIVYLYDILFIIFFECAGYLQTCARLPRVSFFLSNKIDF